MAGWLPLFANTVASGWYQLQAGGGGNIVGMDINPSDGTFLVSGDVFSTWISNVSNAGSNGNWNQLYNASSVPSVNPMRTFFTGGYAGKSAPSNPNTIVAFCTSNFDASGSAIVLSRNKGATLSRISGLPGVSTAPGLQDGFFNGMIVFNPSDDSEWYIGIPNGGGLWHCTSYGAVCTQLDPGTIPSASSGWGYYGMAWRSNTIIICVYGTGPYISTNGGSTWALDGGSPPTKLFSGAFASDGTYYSLNDDTSRTTGNNVYRRPAGGGTWTLISSGQSQWWNGLAVDPNNKDHIAVLNFAGSTNVSSNATGSATWAGVNSSWTITSGDTPWISWSFNGTFGFMNANNCMFDSSSRFWVTMGVGVLYTVSLSGTVSYVPMTQGNEGLPANWVRWVPGGPVLGASWDRPGWVITNPNAPQSTYAPDNLTTIRYSEFIDFAQNNTGFFVLQEDSNLWYSSNSGLTWTKASTTILSYRTCGLAIMSSTQWIVADTNNGNVAITSNSGTSWTSNPTGLSAGAFAFGANHSPLCWDAVTAGTAYVVNTAGTVFKTTNYGSNWSAVSSVGVLSQSDTGTLRLKSVPGNAGHLFYAPGNPGTAPSAQPPNTTTGVFFSSDSGANWTKVTNASFLMVCGFDIGFSAAAPTKSYPSIGYYGWMKTASTSGIYVLDFWRCDDFNPASPTVGTWTQVPWNQLAQVSAIDGNANVYNQWVMSCEAGGSAMGWVYYGPNPTTV